MARPARLNIADMPQHIVQRGNNLQATIVADGDQDVYLDKLHGYSNK
jgi:putative transposase